MCMEDGSVCVRGGWRRMRNRGKEEREERYDDGGKIVFI